MTSVRKGTSLCKMAAAVATLATEPMTRAKLAERVGVELQTADAYIKVLREVGMLRVSCFTKTGAEVFALQIHPFLRPDEQPPEFVRRRNMGRQARARLAESAHGQEQRNQDRPTPGNAGSGPAPGRAGVAPASWIVPGL